MDDFRKHIFAVIAISLSGCASTTDTTKDFTHLTEDPVAIQQRHAVFTDLQPYAVELLDEIRLLAKTRSARANAEMGYKQRESERLYLNTYPGMEKPSSITCKGCEVTNVMRGFAQRIGYGAKNVYSYGNRPPGGVIVDVQLDNQPLQEVLRQIDAQKGAQVDILIDPRTKNIVVKYLEAN